MLGLLLFITTFLILSTYIFFVIRSESSSIKKPITDSIPKQDPPKFSRKVYCPFIVYNSFKLENKTITIPKGSEIHKNIYILNGTVDVFFKGKRVASRSENQITFDPFDMLDVPSGAVKRAASEILAYELPTKINNYVSLKYLEKLVFEPIFRSFKEIIPIVRLENLITTKNFENFLLKNFNLENHKCEQIIVTGEVQLEECMYYVCSGSLIVNEVEFEKNSIFGYFGAFFNYYKGFKCKANPSTILKTVPYSKLKNGKFDTRILKNMPEYMILVGITSDWYTVPQSTQIYSKGTKAEYLYLVNGITHGCKEAVLSSCFESDLIAEKTVDVVRIPCTTIRSLIIAIPGFYHELTLRMFNQPSSPSKIVLITPSKEDYQVFYKRLARTLLNDAIFLKNKNISEILGKNAFYPVGELILNEHLKKLAEKYKVVVVFLENGFSRLLSMIYPLCDIIFIVGNNNTVNRFEGKNIELIKLYDKRVTQNTKKVTKIKNKLVSTMVFYGLLEDSIEDDELENSNLIINPLEKENVESSKDNVTQFRRIHAIMSPKEVNFCNKDYERFCRYLKSERFGLVLGGGGAKGYAHVGVLRALEEENIPIDVVGGTSMGAFVGGMYARELDYMEVYSQTKKLSKTGSSILCYILDLTYPYVSLLAGRFFDNALKGIFKDQQIQNFWLEYFCVSTDLKAVKEAVFFNGSAFRCIRSSMTVAGLLPPVFYKDQILCDGAYVNNVPVDVMKRMDVKNIIVVKVDLDFVNDIDKQDSRSGLVLLLKRIFFKKNYLTLTDIQNRLSFLNYNYKSNDFAESDFVLRPDISKYHASDFHKFEEIVAVGYDHAKKAIREWKRKGLISTYEKINRRYTI